MGAGCSSDPEVRWHDEKKQDKTNLLPVFSDWLEFSMHASVCPITLAELKQFAAAWETCPAVRGNMVLQREGEPAEYIYMSDRSNRASPELANEVANEHFVRFKAPNRWVPDAASPEFVPMLYNNAWAWQQDDTNATWIEGLVPGQAPAGIVYPFSYASCVQSCNYAGEPIPMLRLALSKWTSLPLNVQTAYVNYVTRVKGDQTKWDELVNECNRSVPWSAYSLQFKAQHDERLEAEAVKAFKEMVEAAEAQVLPIPEHDVQPANMKERLNPTTLARWNKHGKCVDARFAPWTIEREDEDNPRSSIVARYAHATFVCLAHASDPDQSNTGRLVRKACKQTYDPAAKKYGPLELTPSFASFTRSYSFFGNNAERSVGPRITMASLPVAIFDASAYDCFLSHKQSDCQDFAKLLKEKLTEKGYRCFLDADNENDIDGLMGVVRKSKNLLFVLSSNIFESVWCMKELKAALDAQCNIILITYSGATWGPNKATFPPAEMIPEDVKPAFLHKAVAHDRQYFEPFLQKLVEKLGHPKIGVQQ